MIHIRFSLAPAPAAQATPCEQLLLPADGVAGDRFGSAIAVDGATQAPGSAGLLCFDGNLGRFDQSIIQGPGGQLDVDVSAIPVNPPVAIQASNEAAAHGQNRTCSASVKFEPVLPAAGSRNQPWKFHVEPGVIQPGPSNDAA